MKKLLRNFILLTALAFTLSACAPDDVGSTDGLIVHNDTEDKAQSYAIETFTLPYIEGETWNPITCSDGTQQVLTPLLYEGLFALDESFAPQNVLCESYSVSDDCTYYTFNIRSGVSFSDGSAMTASDVAASLRSAKASARYSARLANVSNISSNGNVVAVTLSAPNGNLAALLDLPVIKASTAGDTVPLGTGPYAYSGGETPKLVKNTSWWQGEELPLSEISLHGIADDSELTYLFSSRFIQLVSTDLTSGSSNSYTGKVITSDADTTAMQYLGFNCSRAPFNDSAVRAALSLGIDRSTIVSAYLLGHAKAARFPMSPVSANYPEDSSTIYSAEQFAAAMTACGMNSGSRRSATMVVCSDNSFKVSAAEHLAEALSAYDIKITVKALPYEEYSSAIAAGSFDLYYGEVKLTADWDISPLVKTGGRLNYGAYSNDATDLLLQTWSSASGEAASTAQQTLMERIAADAPIVPIAFKTQSYIMHSGVVDAITPTAGNAFYNFSQWNIHIKGETKR